MSMGYPFACTLTLTFCPAKNIAAKNSGLVDQKTEGQKAHHYINYYSYDSQLDEGSSSLLQPWPQRLLEKFTFK